MMAGLTAAHVGIGDVLALAGTIWPFVLQRMRLIGSRELRLSDVLPPF
jgi:hypothetical protein